jgi:uncharacterized DUF497 family protein
MGRRLKLDLLPIKQPTGIFIIHTFIDDPIKRVDSKSKEIGWEQALTIEDDRSDYAETRFVTMAPINSRLCVFAWCWRAETLRVISLRKANKREQRIYDQS